MPFRVARLLLVEHNVVMHKVECSAGDAELHEFMKVKLKEDSEIYEECRGRSKRSSSSHNCGAGKGVPAMKFPTPAP